MSKQIQETVPTKASTIMGDTIFLEKLVDSRVITQTQAERVQKAQDEINIDIELILLKLGFLSESNLVEATRNILSLNRASTDKWKINEDIKNLAPQHFFERWKICPLKNLENEIIIATITPRNKKLISTLEFYFTKKITFEIASPQIIQDMHKLLYSNQHIKDIKTEFNDTNLDISILTASANNAPTVSFTNQLLEQCLDINASDIHMEPLEHDARLRYRVDGVLGREHRVTSSDLTSSISRIKILSNLNIAETRLPQDGKMQTVLRGQKVDFRVSTLPTQFGETMVLRLLKRDELTGQWEDLGFSVEKAKTFDRYIKAPNGLVLVTGPTGSGKTTTLYTALKRINSKELKIITIEDPIEYTLPEATQIQINAEIGLDFASALRAILRQDPDVLMVGEIRDAETAKIAVRAAMTGRLVLSTVHTNSAIGAIDRLIDLDVPPFLLASTIKGIISQRLVRKLCSVCAGNGCPKCDNNGYSGRTVLSEFLSFDESVASLVNRFRDQNNQRKLNEKLDFKTIQDCAQTLVNEGIISNTEAETLLR